MWFSCFKCNSSFLNFSSNGKTIDYQGNFVMIFLPSCNELPELVCVLLENQIPLFFFTCFKSIQVFTKNATRFLIMVDINKKLNCACRWDFSFATEVEPWSSEFRLSYDIHFAIISWVQQGFQCHRRKFFILIFIITWINYTLQLSVLRVKSALQF